MTTSDSRATARLTRSAPAAERSSRLDRDRTASVADEGGASAASFEARDIAQTVTAAEDNRLRLLATLLVLGALVVWTLLLSD